MEIAYLTVLVRAELDQFAGDMARFAAARGNLSVCVLDARGDEPLPAGCAALTPASLLGQACRAQAFLLDIGQFSVLCRLAAVQRLLADGAGCAVVVQPQALAHVAAQTGPLALPGSAVATWREGSGQPPVSFLLGEDNADERCIAFTAGEAMEGYLAWCLKKVAYLERKMNAMNRPRERFPFLQNQWGFLAGWLSYAGSLGCKSMALPWPAPEKKAGGDEGEGGQAEGKDKGPRYENDYFDNGVKIAPILRDYYARDYRLRENCHGDPFACAPLFLEQSARTGDVHPVPLTAPMLAIYQAREDLSSHFPRLDGDWRMPFAAWYLEWAQKEYSLPDAYIEPVRKAYEPHQAMLAANVGDHRPWAERIATRLKIILGRDVTPPAPPAPEYPKGVNLCGFVKGDFGLGEATRILADILDASGIPFTIVDFQGPLEQSFADATWDERIENKFIYNTNVILSNADGLPAFVEGVDEMALKHRYNIGFWYWELPEFPDYMARSFRFVDEVWTASRFTVECFEKYSGGKPVRCIPCSIRAEADESTRADFGIPEDKFVFLQMYDVRSGQGRKNPRAAVDAFLEAFGEREDVLLVLKLNLPEYSKEADGVLALAAAHPNIMTLVGNYPKKRINALCKCCDAYVSLHRSEGFGLGPAEAMYWGRPAVLTNWSGNIEYMRPDNCCPVKAKVVEIEKPWGPYEKGMHWADPDVHDAAVWMKKLADDKAFYEKLSAGAYKTIREEFSPAAIGEKLKARLEELGLL